ncbi:type II toxin-antitoxin system RelE/ParE family toxin [Rhodopseudomonas palustris]|uniref:Type II toxin-antitoxin system RelE/ParE family toxin n=1 Tax=Rhodopseudomonas palustris (strain BisB18) TaxID=316056 RepID=Q20Y77_RHOPB
MPADGSASCPDDSESPTVVLEQITYIAERSPAAAEKIIARMQEARRLLAEHPHSAPPGLIPGTRRMVVNPYILTVRQRNGVVEIAAIRHPGQSDAYKPIEALDLDDDDNDGGTSPPISSI